MTKQFHCDHCEQTVTPDCSPITTGYGGGYDGRKFCYACIAKMDAFAMGWTGRATLYLAGQDVAGLKGDGKYRVSNWPGSLQFAVRCLSKGRHNIARVRYDVYFHGPDGKRWKGVTYGDMTQICHCKRLKSAR